MPLTSGTGRKFGIVLRFINNDVIVGEETASFNPDCSSQNDWQYLSMRVAAKTAYTSLRIILVYECNANVVYFDGVQLFTASGQRISKTVNGTTYNYHYLGDQLVEMAWGANRMHFTYDAIGSLSVNFNGTEYFYRKNAQGDVTGLVDSTGTKVVAYTYGPWGESWSVSGTLASTLGAANLLRYRGYVYDTETGLYYLNSRYYNPVWGRFINADGFVSTGQGISGNNMFAYCGNNPVNRYDPSGNAFLGIMAGAALLKLFIAGAASCLVYIGFKSIINNPPASPPITIPKFEFKSKTAERAKEKEKPAAIPSQSNTTIYRYGGTNPGNLTPREKDKYTGLSFSTIPLPGAAKTTIEALNSTGIVYAVRDSETHVSVRPVGGTMQDWIDAGSASIWTQAVKSVVIKWDGTN